MKTKTKLKRKNNWKTKTKNKKLIKTKITLVYSTTVKMHQFIYSVFCSGSSFRMRISPLTSRNSPTIVSLFIAPAVL